MAERNLNRKDDLENLLNDLQDDFYEPGNVNMGSPRELNDLVHLKNDFSGPNGSTRALVGSHTELRPLPTNLP